MKRTYKAAISSYIGFGIFVFGFSGLVLSPLFIEYPPPKPHDAILAAMMAVGLPVCVFWWLSRFRLTIGPDSISYSSAFGKEQSVDLADIHGAEVVMIYECRRVCLAIKTGMEIRMRIHHKIFSREAYQDLCRVVTPHSSQQPPHLPVD